jgi:hypothetical protein
MTGRTKYLTLVGAIERGLADVPGYDPEDSEFIKGFKEGKRAAFESLKEFLDGLEERA